LLQKCKWAAGVLDILYKKQRMAFFKNDLMKLLMIMIITE